LAAQPWLCSRCEYSEICFSEAERIPCLAVLHIESLRAIQKGANFLRRNTLGQPQLARMKVSNYRRHPAHVIGVGMSQRDRINARNPSRPEIGRDHVFANVHLGMSPEGQAAGIY